MTTIEVALLFATLFALFRGCSLGWWVWCNARAQDQRAGLRVIEGGRGDPVEDESPLRAS